MIFDFRESVIVVRKPKGGHNEISMYHSLLCTFQTYHREEQYCQHFFSLLKPHLTLTVKYFSKYLYKDLFSLRTSISEYTKYFP